MALRLIDFLALSEQQVFGDGAAMFERALDEQQQMSSIPAIASLRTSSLVDALKFGERFLALVGDPPTLVGIVAR